MANMTQTRSQTSTLTNRFMGLCINKPQKLNRCRRDIRPQPPEIGITFTNERIRTRIQRIHIRTTRTQGGPTHRRTTKWARSRQHINNTLNRFNTGHTRTLRYFTTNVTWPRTNVYRFGTSAFLSRGTSTRIFLGRFRLPASNTVDGIRLLNNLASTVRTNNHFRNTGNIRQEGIITRNVYRFS